jgi:membrane protein implicated in regulation of membrane protease activity
MTEPLLTLFGGIDAETAVWAVVALVVLYYGVVAMLARLGERRERTRQDREARTFPETLKVAREIDDRSKP